MFPVQPSYQNKTAQQKTEYENKYIKTFATLKDSVLRESGIFCVGLDTHFAGGALADGSSFFNGILSGWHDLAKTSYGAKLSLDGDVRIYDWKDVENVNSDTLIYCPSWINSEFASIRFDVSALIKEIAGNPEFNTIIYKQGETQFVHGGIAFFGGGKNYSVVETANYSTARPRFAGYQISLEDVGAAYLQVAAGNESFYFMLHDSTTGFLPEHQNADLQSGTAFEAIYPKQ